MKRNIGRFVVGILPLLVTCPLFAQGTLAPDQYEANNTLQTSRQMGELILTTDPGANSVALTIEANLHTETDQDWYTLTVRDEGTPPSCPPHKLRLALSLSAGTAGLVFDVYGLEFANNVSPGNLSGVPGGAQASAEFWVPSCGFLIRPYVTVRVVSGTTAAYSLHVRLDRDFPPADTGTAPPTRGATTCCTLVPNANLKGRLGRIVVHFPANAVPTGTRIAVFKGGNEVQADYGNHIFELLSGAYEVTIAGKRVTNVTVKAGHDTKVKVGVLRITGPKNRRASVREGGQEIAGAYGGELIGLPADTYDVQMAGQMERVVIRDGQITEF